MTGQPYIKASGQSSVAIPGDKYTPSYSGWFYDLSCIISIDLRTYFKALPFLTFLLRIQPMYFTTPAAA